MTSTDSADECFKQIEKSVLEVATQKIDLYCFPENCLYMRVIEGEAVPVFSLSDAIFEKLSKLAVKVGSALHLGSLPLLTAGKAQNSSVLISKTGEVRATYQKIHLFDIELDGQKPIRESDVYQHGDRPHAFQMSDWKFGETICYDLRFAELYSYYASQNVDVILVPSAFLVTTGEAHWEVLLRARAIESQAFVVAAAQAGTHRSTKGPGTRATFGHSLVVDPWGRILQQASSSDSVLVVDLKKENIVKVRKQIPMSAHRRLGLK